MRVFHVREDLLREINAHLGAVAPTQLLRPTAEVRAELVRLLDIGPPDPDPVLAALERIEARQDYEAGKLTRMVHDVMGAAQAIIARLGGHPVKGFGFATLDSLDEKISTLFVGLEKMGMPQSWVSRQRKCPATWQTAHSGGQCDLGYGHGGEFHLDRANQRVWDDQGVQFTRAR